MSYEHNESSITQLRRIIDSAQIFTDVNQCVDFLTDIKDQKVFLILFDEILVPLIHDAPQLDSIYIFCEKKTKLEQEIQEWRKLQGIFTNIPSMTDQLIENIRQREQDLISISIISTSSAIDFNELNSLFIYSQLLIEILLEMPYDEQSKQQFGDFLRSRYADNNAQLRAIDKFERDYDRHSPIWWYTKESFIYSMLNRALRTSDIEIVIKMGFFIRDLHRKIKQVDLIRPAPKISITFRNRADFNDEFRKSFHSFQNSRNADERVYLPFVNTSQDNPDLTGDLQQIEHAFSEIHQTTKILIYRGQGMANTEFEKMKESPGGLISFNNFLSTSTDRQVSLAFAESSGYNLELTGILFQMEIDPSILSAPFASLDNSSYYLQSEEEVLLSMHTVFRIGDLKPIGERLWQVNLTSAEADDEQLKHLTKHIREEIAGKTAWHRLSRLMITMGELNKAKEIYEKLLEQTSDDDRKELAFLHHQLGYIDDNRGDPIKALSHFKQTLDISLTYMSSDDPRLSSTYSNIGVSLLRQGDLDRALEHQQHALDVLLCDSKSHHATIACLHTNIGSILALQKKYADALKSHASALRIVEAHLSFSHALLAGTYSNIGAVHLSMNDPLTALSFIEKTLTIRQKFLPPTHPDLPLAHHKIAIVLEDLERYTEAVEHILQAIDIAHQTLAPSHPQMQMYQCQLSILREKLRVRINK